jgi:hypothetical protein
MRFGIKKISNLAYLLGCMIHLVGNAGIIELNSNLVFDTTRDTSLQRVTEGFVRTELQHIVLDSMPVGHLSLEWFGYLDGRGLPLTPTIDEESKKRNLELVTGTLLDTTIDTDLDQISDGFEGNVSLTNPEISDSITDGINDMLSYLVGETNKKEGEKIKGRFTEVIAKWNLDTSGDDDQDKLTNSFETEIFASNPDRKDTNGDGNSDFLEYLLQITFEIFVEEKINNSIDILASFQMDTTLDSDNDGLSDGYETNNTSTSITQSMTYDLDLDDFYLHILGAKLLTSDTKTEILELLTGTILDTTEDLDSDRLSAGFETYIAGTEDTGIDSDSNGISDFYQFLFQNYRNFNEGQITSIFEVIYATLIDTTNDLDKDGLSDGFEKESKIHNFELADTNGDGQSDTFNLLAGPYLIGNENDIDPGMKLGVFHVSDSALTVTIHGKFQKGDSIKVLSSNDLITWSLNFELIISDPESDIYEFFIPITQVNEFFILEIIE